MWPDTTTEDFEIAPREERTTTAAARRAFAWLALGAAAFTAYASLVPLQFRARPPGEALAAFGNVLAAGPRPVSRSDAVANVLLGVPLGFALLGVLCADRGWPRRKAAGRGLLLLPACALFAACVEFAQLFTTGRDCSGSDILAQLLGAATGMGAWLLGGQRLTDRVRAALDTSGRLLVALVALVAFIQTLPFDATLSPFKLHRKLLNGGAVFTPFGEFAGLGDAERWKGFGELAKLAGLFFPIGLLAARMKGRTETWGVLRVVMASLALAVCLEALQLVVESRTPSATDVLVGALAALAGWLAARIHHEGLAIPFALSWFIVWLAAMTPVSLPPAGAPRLEAPRPFEWAPGPLLESGDPLRALGEVLARLVLFGLLGVLVAAWRLPPRARRAPQGSVRAALALAAFLGLLTSCAFENAQRWAPAHTPSITDGLLGGLGAALGVLAASRARNRSLQTVTP